MYVMLLGLIDVIVVVEGPALDIVVVVGEDGVGC